MCVSRVISTARCGGPFTTEAEHTPFRANSALLQFARTIHKAGAEMSLFGVDKLHDATEQGAPLFA